jgi:SOS response associated peptidase (SRAP)
MWRSPASERVRRFATITTKPNELCAELHDRMPVIVALEHSRIGWGRSHPAWSMSKRCSRQFPSEEITCWPVSPRVGNVRNNDPNLIDPTAAAVHNHRRKSRGPGGLGTFGGLFVENPTPSDQLVLEERLGFSKPGLAFS